MENKFVIVNNNCDVEILGNFEDEGNLVMFGVSCENQEYADVLARELEPVVAYMNEQERIINNE